MTTRKEGGNRGEKGGNNGREGEGGLRGRRVKTVIKTKTHINAPRNTVPLLSLSACLDLGRSETGGKS